MARRSRPEWRADDLGGRRWEIYARAAPVFERDGYRGSTLKVLAEACGLSIPGLYRYFPSKRALALFPLASIYPELRPPPPDMTVGDPLVHLARWIEASVADLRFNVLAVRLALETGLSEDEDRRSKINLEAHIDSLAEVIARAGPGTTPATARQAAAGMVELALGRAITGAALDPAGLARDLRWFLRRFGIVVPRPG